MKKLILIVLILFFNIPVCYAIIEGQDNHGTLTTDQLVLGYISINDNAHTVRKIYGTPSSIITKGGLEYYYGSAFYIYFYSEDGENIAEITTIANNGIKTADGIHVGMPEGILNKTYGTPSYKKQEGAETKYWYYGYESNNWKYLQFTIRNGKIIKISLCWVD